MGKRTEVQPSLTLRILRLLGTFRSLSTPDVARVLDRTPAQAGALLAHLAGPNGRRAVTRLHAVCVAAPGRPAIHWTLTDTGRAILAGGGGQPLQTGAVPHLTLSRACGEPMTARELWEAVCARYGAVDLDTVAHAARSLYARALLAEDALRQVQPGAEARTYVLTPAGEDMLTRLPRPA